VVERRVTTPAPASFYKRVLDKYCTVYKDDVNVFPPPRTYASCLSGMFLALQFEADPDPAVVMIL